MSKDKTIKQLADEIGVSKQALYKRIKREPLHTKIHTYLRIKGQTTYIDIHGQNIIKSVIKEDNCIQKTNTNPNKELHTHIQPDTVGMQSIMDLLSKQLEEKDNQILKLNDRLEEQLKSKDNQISELHQRLAESQELHRNQQILLKQSQDKVLELEAPLEKKSWLKRKK